MHFLQCATHLGGSFLFDGGAWHRMSYKPTLQTVGKAVIRDQSIILLGTLSACFLFHTHFIPFANFSLPDNSQSSRFSGTDPSSGFDVCGVAVSSSRNSERPQTPRGLVGDLIVCVETEDLDSLEEDPGHPQWFAESDFPSLGQFSNHNSPRPLSLPFVANHGLMSRRF
jgi:hypothetical protein